MRPGTEMFLNADGRLTDGADIKLSDRLFQMVRGSGDREGPAADSRQLHGRHHSVAEWLACWTQAQKGVGSNRRRDALG